MVAACSSGGGGGASGSSGASGASGSSGSAKDSAWLGNTYVLTVPSANWTQPPNIGSDIGSFVPQFLIGISQSSGDMMTVTMGTAMGGVQDDCNVTTQATADGSGYPDATITFPALPLHIVNTVSGAVVDTTARNFTLTNVLPGAGGTASKSGTLSAVLDISELYPLFNQIPASSRTPDGVCNVLKTSANAPCMACPTTGKAYCLTLEAVQLGAVQGSTSVMPIAPSAVPASCAASDAGTTPFEDAEASNEGGAMQPPADAAASTDAAAPVDASESDANSNSHRDAAAAADAGDSQ